MTVLLVDLSNNNGSVDFGRLALVPGITGVYLKASEGHSFTDATFAERRREANRHGLRVGAYHFARFGGLGGEVARFVSTVGSLDRRDLRPALDAESGNGRGTAPWCRGWMGSVQRALGTLPIFYSYPAWIVDMAAGRPIGAGLWLASYGRDDGLEHPYRVPAPWRAAVAHQFTSRGHVAGVAGVVDVSSAASIVPLLAHPVLGRV